MSPREKAAKRRLNLAIGECSRREFTLDGFDFDKPREVAKKALAAAAEYPRASHSR